MKTTSQRTYEDGVGIVLQARSRSENESRLAASKKTHSRLETSMVEMVDDLLIVILVRAARAIKKINNVPDAKESRPTGNTHSLDMQSSWLSGSSRRTSLAMAQAGHKLSHSDDHSRSLRSMMNWCSCRFSVR